MHRQMVECDGAGMAACLIDGSVGDEAAAAHLAQAARRFAAHDPLAHGYLMEMARSLRIQAMHRRAHAPT